MSIKRWNARRDANEAELVAAARKVGIKVWPLDTPCDLLVAWNGKLYAVEVKLPEGPKGGLKDKTLTYDQKIFASDLQDQDCELIVWRTVDDVLKFVALRNVA
jgi:hypothetical protein